MPSPVSGGTRPCPGHGPRSCRGRAASAGGLIAWNSGSPAQGSPRPTEPARTIAKAALAGEPAAAASLDAYVDRLARGLAVIADILDPDAIVLGGGMSNVEALYERLPAAIGSYAFSDVFTTPVRKAAHGDSSGVRGAAWLWPLEPGP